jgi:hypothetical protein
LPSCHYSCFSYSFSYTSRTPHLPLLVSPPFSGATRKVLMLVTIVLLNVRNRIILSLSKGLCFQGTAKCRNMIMKQCKKLKSYPRNRPWRPIGFGDVKVPTLSRQSAHS